ncbi:hypothetical protein N182_23025 [Sinorhizobium sp. GL2]|nr:hypothetical protein N182_23025 [Sinorhizobium sp. GL2]
MVRKHRADVHTQSSLGGAARAGDSAVHVIEIREQAKCALMIGGAFRGHSHSSGRSFYELRPEMRFEILYEFADGGPGQVQRVCGFCEGSRFGNADEGSYGEYLIQFNGLGDRNFDNIPSATLDAMDVSSTGLASGLRRLGGLRG